MKFYISSSDAILPSKATPDSAGYDFYSTRRIIVRAGKTATIETSIAAQIPNSKCGFLKSRSGLYNSHLIAVFPGVIDSDYVDEIKIILHNQK